MLKKDKRHKRIINGCVQAEFFEYSIVLYKYIYTRETSVAARTEDVAFKSMIITERKHDIFNSNKVFRLFILSKTLSGGNRL